MSSTGTFLAFGTVMLVVALLGVAIDWFGKPMRHRRFVPKIYRYPDERYRRPPTARALQSSAPLPDATAPALPLGSVSGPPALDLGLDLDLDLDLDEVVEAPAPSADPDAVGSFDGFDIGVDADPAPALVTIEELAETEPLSQRRAQGWSPGDYVYNLTAGGNEPAPSTVRVRYWRNVAAAPGSAVFGAENVRRMSEGKAPRRRNAHSGKFESMRLPSVDYLDSEGETPVPSWPETSIDPFS